MRSAGGLAFTLLLGLSAAIPGVVAAPAPAPPPDPKGIEFFESKVRPVLAEHCYACHSGKNSSGGLKLDTAAGFFKGGASGTPVAPGHPEKSLLITAVGYRSEALKMPPQGRLKPQAVADLTSWVRMGAPWGQRAEGKEQRAPVPNAQRPHWSFQPVRVPAVPAVKNQAWVKSPIDAFVLSRLEAKGLAPAPAADRRTLIRRVTYDLTGLPPTETEVAPFLADRSPDAWEKVVDRLLASPAYGERWGRHWLDVVRYADSNGLDENTAFGNAWRYRDYVIKSFNDDKPYDQFLREQLAGDLLWEEMGKRGNGETGKPVSTLSSSPHFPISQSEALTATGFLCLGPKVLAEPDKQKMVMDIVDEQIDTTGKAFLGLTLGCARCHDHKFDPIPTKDYYGLAGIFKSTRTMATLNTVARVLERPLGDPEAAARQEAHEKQVLAKKNELRDATARLNAQPPDTEAAALVARLRTELAELEKAAPEPVPMVIAVEEEKTIGNVRVHIRGNPLTLGDEVPRHFPVVLAGAGQSPIGPSRSGRLELADWIASPRNPLTARVLVNRVWQHLFGDGLVRTPDDFGTRGERPTHPELLDWLAARFAQGIQVSRYSGIGKARASDAEYLNTRIPDYLPARPWSIKRLIRQIVLSNTYRMSTRYEARAAGIDPENRLLWRANRKRLEVEAIRDGMLAVSGRLDRTMGGSLLTTPNFGYVTNDQSANAAQYDVDRRSIYLPVIRNAVFDVFQVFDFVEPSVLNGKRATTTVAPQALFLMNGKFVLSQSRAFAERLLSGKETDDAARLAAAYQKAYARSANPDEVAAAQRYIGAYEGRLAATEKDPSKRRLAAWASFCQVLVASSEFVYIN